MSGGAQANHPSIDSTKLILASASPRRSEILSRIASDFIVVASEISEHCDGTPEEQVLTLAEAKARAVAIDHQGVIIGADTIVVVDGRILGKPHSREQGRQMLIQLSGRAHDVLTGLCVLRTDDESVHVRCEKTRVWFRDLTEREIDHYLDTNEYVDKAGGYAIQGQAAAFITGIDGDYFNVMGLPLCRLVLILREVGIDLLA